MLLQTEYRGRFSFTLRELVQLDGRTVRRVDYRERAKPTIVMSSRGMDVPLEGTYWIEEGSGVLVKALVKTRGTPDPGRVNLFDSGANGETRMSVEVAYEWCESVGAAVPSQMQEWGVTAKGAAVTGNASYSKYRRFDVSTDITFK